MAQTLFLDVCERFQGESTVATGAVLRGEALLAGGAYIAHFAMCAKRRCCHPERSEGSRQLLRELPGFFAALRMTPERVATACSLCRGPLRVRPLTHPRQQSRAVATNSLCRSKQPRKAASPEDGTYPTCYEPTA
jgi:hypothetical protein